MKYGIIKKITALCLALLLLSVIPLSVSAKITGATPVIFIPDMTQIILYQSPNTLNERAVFDMQSQKATTYFTDIAAGLLTANTNVSQGAAKISGVINQIFSPIQCDEYGNPKNTNLGPVTYNSPVSYNLSEPIYTDNIKAFAEAAKGKIDIREMFVFEYDWRIDPSENAELLRQFIDRVKANTGKSAVSVISGGYGGVVLNGYLYYYEEHAQQSLSSALFLDSLATGSSLLGDIMSGDIIRTVSDVIHEPGNVFEIGEQVYNTITGKDVGDAFARYVNTDPLGLVSRVFSNLLGTGEYSSLLAALTLSLASFVIDDQDMFEKLGSGYQEIMLQADDYIYNAGLREYLRNMPGLWAVVPDESYDDAVEFLFGKDPEISSELLEKMQRSHALLEATQRTVRKAASNGINVCISCGYDLQILPITACLNEQSDGLQATRYAGLGATTGDMKKDLEFAKMCSNGNHNHMEPNNAVDAATCYLPESTWFIRYHAHMDFSAATSASFLVWLVTATVQRNVWQSELYPQYLQKSRIGDAVTAYSDPSDSDVANYRYGDLDFNGKINSADARMALRYAVGVEKVDSRRIVLVGDVSGNGVIDAADARLILRFAVGLETGFKGVK